MPQANPALNAPRSHDIREFINACPISLFQLRIVALCFLIVAIDGFDTMAVGFIAPRIRDYWALGPAALSPMFAAGLLGLMLGAFLFGPLADKLGRRTILVCAVAWFGLACVASAFSPSFDALVALRFVTGLGLGGAMPNAITLTAEYCPERRRSTLLTLMFCGFSLGGALAGVITSFLISHFGWRSVLIAGGAFPLLLVPVFLLFLPESARFLVMRGAPGDRVARVLGRLAHGGALDDGSTFTVRDTKTSAGISVVDLFRHGYWRNTLLLWATFCMGLLIIYLLASWLPIVIRSTGQSLHTAVLIAALLQTGGIVGALAMGRVMDRVNPCRVVATAYCLGSAAVFLIGHAHSLMLLALGIFLTGCCISGSQVCISILAASFYPTHCRATGVSWASGIGRFGSIAGSVAGGIMLSWGWTSSTIFSAMAIPALIAATAMFLLARRYRPA